MQSHFFQALKQVAGTSPPEFMTTVTIEEYRNFDEAALAKVQSWVLENTNLPWGTVMGVIDAAMCLVQEAVNQRVITEGMHCVDRLCLAHGKHEFHSFGSQILRRCNWCGEQEEK